MGKRFSLPQGAVVAMPSGKLKKKVPGYEEDFQSRLIRLESDVVSFGRSYEELEAGLLGEGITGSVREVLHMESGKRFAVKSINLERINKAQAKELQTEIGILRQLDHPGIVKLHEVYMNKNDIKLVMELLTGGSLAQRQLTTEEEVRSVIFQVLTACNYWHSRGVVHRDLKLENIMFSNDEGLDVKVIDFGLGTTFFSDKMLELRKRRRMEAQIRASNSSRRPVSLSEERLRSDSKTHLRQSSSSSAKDLFSGESGEEGSTSTLRLSGIAGAAGEKLVKGGIATVAKVRRTAQLGGSAIGSPIGRPNSIPKARNVAKSRIFQTTCGTAYYMAPEIMFGRGYTSKCDLWAIGVITYMLIAGKPPFPGRTEKEVFLSVKRCNPDYDCEGFRNASPEARDFVKHLLTLNPTLRWSAQQTLESPWINGRRDTSIQQENKEEFERRVVHSLMRFSKYPTLKRAALMIISHNVCDFQDQKLNHCFLKIDEVNQGSLSFENLQEFILLHEPWTSAEQVQRVFSSMDQDHTESIRYMEFLAATLETTQSITEEMIRTAFVHFDTEKSGMITLKSLKKLLGRGFAKRDLEDIIGEASEDTKISFSKFSNIMKAEISDLDHDDPAFIRGVEQFDDDVFFDAEFFNSSDTDTEEDSEHPELVQVGRSKSDSSRQNPANLDENEVSFHSFTEARDEEKSGNPISRFLDLYSHGSLGSSV